MTDSARRVAAGLSAVGAVALAISLFLSWQANSIYIDGWERFGGLDMVMAATAALGLAAAFVVRLRPLATIVALAVLAAVVIDVKGDVLAATAPGPAIAFIALLAIAAGGTGLRARWLAAVGAGALVMSSLAPCYVTSGDGALVHRSTGDVVFAYAREALDAWHRPAGDAGIGLVLASAALLTIAVAGAIRARSR